VQDARKEDKKRSKRLIDNSSYLDMGKIAAALIRLQDFIGKRPEGVGLPIIINDIAGMKAMLKEEHPRGVKTFVRYVIKRTTEEAELHHVFLLIVSTLHRLAEVSPEVHRAQNAFEQRIRREFNL
jgi:hypothetical protein